MVDESPKLNSSTSSGFGKDLTGPHALYIGGDYVALAGKYEVQGRVLLLPINGAGDSNITLGTYYWFGKNIFL